MKGIHKIKIRISKIIELVDYYNELMEVREENDDYFLCFSKSRYDINNLTREKTFIPSKYSVLKKINQNEVEVIVEYPCEKGRTYLPPDKMLELKKFNLM